PFYPNTIKRPWLPSPNHPRRAGVSAFGFGGSNFHCVLEEHRPHKPGIDWDGDVQIIALSANAPDGLKAALSGREALVWDDLANRAAESRRSFQIAAEVRLLLVIAKSGPPVGKVIAATRELLDKSPGSGSAEGVYFGRGPATGKLGVLFPGQGSQYVGMLRDLACQFPAMQEVLAEANTAEG